MITITNTIAIAIDITITITITIISIGPRLVFLSSPAAKNWFPLKFS